MHGGVDQRVAWLLAASRIHAADPELAYREKFVTALNDAGIAADQARVSRWESGSNRVPDRIVVAYEQVLGIPEGQISAAVNGLRRTLDPGADNSDVVITPPHTMHDDLELLFSNTYDDADGAHWLKLTDYLAVHRNIYLRGMAWTDLADRLTAETVRSTGNGFTRRLEALRTLIRHPGGQKHVVRSIGAFVTDPAAQSVIYPLTLLQEVDHPKAQELVMRLLGTSSGQLQQGAAWVAAAKLVRGHFDPEEQRRLEGLSVLMIAAGPKATPEVDIFDVAARLPGEARERVVNAVRESASFPRLDMLLTTGEILPRPVTRDIAHKIATMAQATTPAPYRIEPDMMLERLVREALFHGHQERRHQAAVLLTVSPYRAGVAAACARATRHPERGVAQAAVMLLRYLGTEAERPDLLALARSVESPDLAAPALISLGRLPDGLSDDETQLVVDALDGTEKLSVQRAGLYALGMSGSERLTELADADNETRAKAADWWTRVGPAIHESVPFV